MHGVYTGVLVGRALQEFAAALFRERCVHVVGDRPLRALHRDHEVVDGVADVEQVLVARGDQVGQMPGRVSVVAHGGAPSGTDFGAGFEGRYPRFVTGTTVTSGGV